MVGTCFGADFGERSCPKNTELRNENWSEAEIDPSQSAVGVPPNPALQYVLCCQPYFIHLTFSISFLPIDLMISNQ